MSNYFKTNLDVKIKKTNFLENKREKNNENVLLSG